MPEIGRSRRDNGPATGRSYRDVPADFLSDRCPFWDSHTISLRI
ncbi:hypothetical protein HM1_2679 [Heliomicrobium modesticaldum Ice1]|uniref:Uncharacterized protein n=1 Tax=Heliobacterium modesticaldum (strain ATCC 51547 / Ice1) TaxID=498761 RepID=B0TBJ5_HELMI|nr:hypothetical protein HM1_2679 [Heliomicrobium modesticaldum Ice1]